MPKHITHVSLDPRARMHAAFLVITLVSCGLGAIPWIIWAVTTRNQE